MEAGEKVGEKSKSVREWGKGRDRKISWGGGRSEWMEKGVIEGERKVEMKSGNT